MNTQEKLMHQKLEEKIKSVVLFAGRMSFVK